MELLVIRHAPAEERRLFVRRAQPDSLRPLTADGVRKMRRVAAGLKRIAGRVDLLVSSPLRRARQTADIVARALGKVRRAESAELAPEAPSESLVRWLRGRRERRIAVVGHEPHLSLLVAHLCGGRARPFTALRKGGACLLEFKGRASARGATLVWLMRPGDLKDLA